MAVESGFYWGYWICIKNGVLRFDFSRGGFTDFEQAKDYAKKQVATGIPVCAWVVHAERGNKGYKDKDIPYMEVFDNMFQQQIASRDWIPFNFSQ